jgi:hypothetical protein
MQRVTLIPPCVAGQDLGVLDPAGWRPSAPQGSERHHVAQPGRRAAEHLPDSTGRLPGDRIRAAELHRGSGITCASVDPEQHVGIKHCDERLKVPLASSGEEGVDDLSLTGAVGG